MTSDPSSGYWPPLGPLRILHVDAELISVEKPPGLLSVPGKAPDLAECVMSRLAALWPGALLVHRLDRDTSGVMIFARTRAAQRHLGLQFERRRVTKDYTALVAPAPIGEGGTIDLPLGADWPNRPRQKVDRVHGRAARTHWRVLKRNEDGSARVTLRPETGRSHQLRIHMLENGSPIMGDPLYGPDAARPRTRLMLHATRLALRHPNGGQTLCLVSAPGF